MRRPTLIDRIGWAGSLLAAVALAVLAGCGQPNEEGAAADSTAADSGVKPIVLGPENYSVVLQERIATGPSISGTLTPKQQATMRAELPGAVLRTYVEPGEAVGAGTLLAKIDDRTIQSSIAAAKSGLTNAQAGLSVSQRELKRLETLLAAGAIAERDVDNARRGVIAGQAAVAAAEAQLDAAQKQLSFTEVHAPYSGRVSQKLVSTGDIVQPGSAMFTVIDPSSLQLEASIPAEQVSSVQVGDQVEFRLNGYPDQIFIGRITRINPSADPVTRQARVYAELPNTGSALLADVFADGWVTTQAKNTFTIPATAVDRKMMRPAAIKVTNGEARRVEISLGLTDPRTDRVEVISGLAPGDTVLVGPAMSTPEGSSVQLTPRSGAGGAGTARTAPSGNATSGAGSAATGTGGSK